LNIALFGILCLLWAGATFFFYHYRLWFLFYVVGAVGSALLIIYGGHALIPLERWLETSSAYSVHGIAALFGVQTRIFQEAPGSILVLVIPQGQGWTMLEIGIECSGLLEGAVLFGLLAFFPGWTAGPRIGRIFFGFLATFFGNLVRLLFIVLTLAYLGKDTLFLSHTVIGRIIFFLFVVIIFWTLITRPTLQQIRADLLKDKTG